MRYSGWVLLVVVAGCSGGNKPPDQPKQGANATSAQPVPGKSNEQFAITLKVSTGAESQTAAWSDREGRNERPLLTAKAPDGLTVKWVVTNETKDKTISDVTVHCFLAAQDKVGQTEPVPLEEGVINESALTMDFEPGAVSSADLSVQVPPGLYQLCVETIGTKATHRAIMDLQIQP